MTRTGLGPHCIWQAGPRGRLFGNSLAFPRSLTLSTRRATATCSRKAKYLSPTAEPNAVPHRTRRSALFGQQPGQPISSSWSPPGVLGTSASILRPHWDPTFLAWTVRTVSQESPRGRGTTGRNVYATEGKRGGFRGRAHATRALFAHVRETGHTGQNCPHSSGVFRGRS